MNVPDKCKDCMFLKYNIKTDNKSIPVCMLSHPFSLAGGCPNKKTDSYHSNCY